jgi:FkbM family methyltransferase
LPIVNEESVVSAEDHDVIWGLEDYALFVPMSDQFYKTLPFKRITLEQFRSGSYSPQPSYRDSRTYMEPILRHLSLSVGVPDIFDVGGYIGRFSIEAILACAALDLSTSVRCFEPGDTVDLLRRNLELNGVANQVELLQLAVSDKEGHATLGVPSDAKISSRLVPDRVNVAKDYGSKWSARRVEMVRLERYLALDDSPRPFICKLDTEGHEAKVMQGIGRNFLLNVPHVLIVEYWPAVREQRVLDQPFEEFLTTNYVIFDIRSSLYPAGFRVLGDLDEISERVSSREVNNVDLLLIRRNVPEVDSLVRIIQSLASQ